ncbi:elongation of very long chain fatty acids protein 4-like [Belonocnema kinseyi]|uniref:elongation of very long chain fatty acids protein 4-like n=1 Tax=Belonocnema kinseyi TaxID=2817044 RepID=UPI00143CEDF5|nr:elongation of very long chain fatty acids protein 4-like [Belonocnema kinseyi]
MGLTETYNYYYHEVADPRVKNWPLMGDPWPTLLIIASYLYFVFQYGPQFMKNRPAYELKTFIQFYNLFQVFANAYIVSEFLAVYPDATALRCVTSDPSWNPDAVRALKACYCVTLLKIVDLIETGLFVLRKKKNQISFLHVYHHISTLHFSLALTRYYGGGMAVLYPALNCAVHVTMYSYYFLSSIEGIKEVVHPIKRYITMIQMVQFIFMMLHTLVSLKPSCNFPKLPPCLLFGNLLFNFYLFYNFYKKAYSDPKKTKKGLRDSI